MLDLQVGTLRPADLDAAIALLVANDLPTDDLRAPSIALVGARSGAALAGVAGLQRCGDVGLLRSLAVAPAARSGGIGRRLCEHVFDLARMERLTALYLMTTTARDYFVRLGFAVIDRAQVPDPIRATSQFASLCPSTATVMRLAR